ncbi:FAD-binding monooxygenase [Ktedonobacter sp. SOSP1-85]|uniref:FAD-dependent monooxygenase n=1 Tax=Ktedonobacter sp. SOSP1-85 TaxID=2778367 RepID=UPI001915CAF9|nr:FAD-dependent monooxygenase [Ktedonobacter sp. SOSP1-85]GHO78609.1 FAD-binding monooxygenase [Ktedonobacter sp. SOSP1-85]
MNNNNTTLRVPVLIVGGGIVGLSASLFLLQQDIPFLLVERHSGTSIHPRARGVNNRTMELYRTLGLEEAVREAGASLAPAMGILNGSTLVEALDGFQAPKARVAFGGMLGSLGEVSPTAGTRVTQDELEPVLLASARQRGGDLRFFTELTSFTQNEEGVTATIRDRSTGQESTVQADYMIAADGANSPIRQKLGCSVSGKGSLGHLINVLFKADLRELVHEREFSLCTINNPLVHGLFTSINLSDTWVFHIGYDPGQGMSAEQFKPERCKELVRIALGLPDIEIEVKSIMPWESAMRVVDNFQHGRVFFAGDAAHQMPPWGGQGANSGIADVNNLVWKLGLVLKRVAGPSLLVSYNAERHPVDYLAAAESAAAADGSGMMAMNKQGGPGDIANRFTRILGYYSYGEPSQAIIPDQAPISSDLDLDGRPGTRVPHLWGERQGQAISTLDFCGTGFVLLAGPEGHKWHEAAQQVAQDLHLDIQAYRIGADGDLLDPENRWPALAGISPSGALLVRPDGYIAWRAQEESSELEQVCRALLAGRDGEDA